MDEKKYQSARAYIEEQFNEFGDSSWLEGWICGFTDPEANSNSDEMKVKLLERVGQLQAQKNKTLDTVGDLIEWLELLGRDRTLIYDSDGNTDSVYPTDIVIWNENDPNSPVSINTREI